MCQLHYLRIPLSYCSLIFGVMWNTVDRGRKRAYVACVLIKLVPVNWQLVVEVDHARLSANVGN